MSYDVVIVGGSFAGQSAAMQLARARRRVLLVDAKRPRNRFARSSHGFLGQDGRPPATIIEEAARQLSAYPTVTQVEEQVVAARPADRGFVVRLGDGREEQAARIILAMGVRDRLPDIPGMEPRWGVSVFHCPYCHGYEVAGSRLGVLARIPASLHQAALIPDWGPTTLFTQGAVEPDAQQAALLESRGVVFEGSPIVELLGEVPRLEAVRLADGRVVELAALFVAPETEVASDLATQLGCAFEEGPTGRYIRVDGRQQTNVEGVFAAGDAAMAMANATLAAASGVMAAAGAHHSLIHAAGTTASATERKGKETREVRG